MDRFGFIHEKLDIKIFILYVLNMLPGKINAAQLSDLIMIDDGFDYFEYSQCLTELVETQHVEQDGSYYKITEKGSEHCEAVSSSIPYSVKAKAERAAQPLIGKMKRDALIGTSHKIMQDGSCHMRVSLSDGMGDILKLTILTSGEEQSEQMEKYFRSDAESIYHKIIGLLTPEEK